MSRTSWLPLDGSPEEVYRAERPFEALRRGDIPAIILRNAYPAEHCAALMRRFYETGHLYDPRAVGDGKPKRVDIGSSFGNRGHDLDAFFAHANETRRLFSSLFDGYGDPVATIYDALQRLAPDKHVRTAREPDGREYGPAIFRAYHRGLGHVPHYDSVKKREKRLWSATADFDYQFAGVLCFQTPDGDKSVDVTLHRANWTPELQPTLDNDAFHAYARANGIDSYRVSLNPGDLYFFFSENIHEVPPITGDTARCVLAVFFGMSDDREDVFVWS